MGAVLELAFLFGWEIIRLICRIRIRFRELITSEQLFIFFQKMVNNMDLSRIFILSNSLKINCGLR